MKWKSIYISKVMLFLESLGKIYFLTFSSFLSLFNCSVMSDYLWPQGMQHTRLPGPSLVSWSLLNLMSIESVIPSNHLILCHPLLLLPSVFPSIRAISNESALCIMWLKYLSFVPFNEHSGLISFRMDCLDLLAVQGTLRSLLQHHSS